MTTDINKSSATTRTTSKDAVNPAIDGTVNDQQTRTGKAADKGGSKIAHEIVPNQGALDLGNEPPAFVPEGTKSRTELLEIAREAATAADIEDANEKDRRKEETERSKMKGRDVIACMLRFIESFNGPDGSVNQESLTDFLNEKIGKAHGKAKSPFHRLSRYCSLSDTPKAMISKRSYVLDIVVQNKMNVDDFIGQYDEPEEIGPENKKRSGMAKYVLLYQIEKGLVKNDDDKIEALREDKLVHQATRLLNELAKRNILSDELLAKFTAQVGNGKV